MASHDEYRTVVSCSKQLETALHRPSRDLVYFLHQEGFITQEVCDDVLNARSMLTDHQKAGELVAGIRNKVKLRAQDYHTLLDHLRKSGKYYESIVNILDTEFSRQQQSTTGDIPALQELSPVLTRYRKYLKSYYKNYPIARDDKLSIAPCSQFITLALIQRGEDSKKLQLRTPLALDKILTDSQFVLVKGPPGIGKSTMCWELCREWDTLESLQCFKIVLLLKLREKRVQNATELNEIFHHRDKKLCQSVVDEVFECEGEGVLLILDGFDEMPDSLVNDRSSLIVELIDGTCLPEASRLVTSRPSIPFNTLFPEDHRCVEIFGFTDERKVEYAEATFKSEPEVCEHFKDFILSNPTIISMMNVPMNCAIIAQVYKDIKQSGKQLIPKTMTQLYTTLVLVLIRRHMIGKGQWDKNTKIPASLSCLPEVIFTRLRRIGELAYKGWRTRQSQFSDEDVGEDFQHLGLLYEAKEMYVTEGAKLLYSFSHLSIQEFLTAYHYSSNPSLLPETSLIVSVCRGVTVFGQFLAGFTGCREHSKNDIICYPHVLVPYLYEAQDSCKCLEGLVVSEIDGCRYCPSNPDGCRYHPSNPLVMCAFGYVLVHASIQWELTLNAFSCVPQLVDALANHQQILGAVSKLTIRNFWTFPSFSKIKELPACLLENIKKLEISFYDYYLEYIFNTHDDIDVNEPSAQLLDWISLLCNVHTLTLYGICPLDNSHSLYQTIASLSNLKSIFFYFSTPPTMEEIKELSHCLAGHTLEHVKLIFEGRSIDDDDNVDYLRSILFLRGSEGSSDVGNTDSSSDFEGSEVGSVDDSSDSCIEGTLMRRKLELCALVKAALSCPTLVHLETNIPFLISRDEVSCDLIRINFCYSPSIWPYKALNYTLCCIADMCKLPSMRYLCVSYNDGSVFIRHGNNMCPAPDEFLAILNESLHQNSSFTYLGLIGLHLSSNYKREVFSNTLRTHTSLLSWDHSKSTEDIKQPGLPTGCIFYRNFSGQSIESFRIGSRWQSCPDLVQMQSLHTMHILLFKALGCERLYYGGKRY